MISAPECRAYSARYEKLAKAADISIQRATALLAIANSWARLADQTIASFCLSERKLKPSTSRSCFARNVVLQCNLLSSNLLQHITKSKFLIAWFVGTQKPSCQIQVSRPRLQSALERQRNAKSLYQSGPSTTWRNRPNRLLNKSTLNEAPADYATPGLHRTLRITEGCAAPSI